MRSVIIVLIVLLVFFVLAQILLKDRIDLFGELKYRLFGGNPPGQTSEAFHRVKNFPPPPYIHNPGNPLWSSDASKQRRLLLQYQVGGRRGDEPKLRFYIPIDLAADSKGNVYVLDKGYGRIVQIDTAGNFVRFIYYRQEGKIAFQKPYLLAIDNQDRFYVIDDLNRLFIFSKDWKEKQIRLNYRAYDLCVDSSGNIFILTPADSFRLHKFNPKGKEVLAFSPQEKSDKKLWEVFSRGSIALAANDTLYYSQEYPYRIIKYDPQGVPVLTFDRDLGIIITPPTIHRDGFGKVISVNRQQMSYGLAITPENEVWNLARIRGGKGGDLIDVFTSKGQYVQSLYLGKNQNHLTLIGKDGLVFIRPYPFEQVEKYKIVPFTAAVSAASTH